MLSWFPDLLPPGHEFVFLSISSSRMGGFEAPQGLYRRALTYATILKGILYLAVLSTKWWRITRCGEKTWWRHLRERYIYIYIYI